jgi:aspartate ammonia-lyase
LLVNSIGIVTALNPILGYETCSRIAKRALAERRSIVDLVVEEGLMERDQIAELLKPDLMVRPGRAHAPPRSATAGASSTVA